MSEIIIINSIKDAVHCIQHKLNVGRVITTTNASISVYMELKYQVECLCLSSLIPLERHWNLLSESHIVIEDLLEKMDLNISPLVNQELQTNLKYFKICYSYLAKSHYVSLKGLSIAINYLYMSNNAKKIYIYDDIFQGVINATLGLDGYMQHFLPELNYEIIGIVGDKKSIISHWLKFIGRYRHYIKNPALLFKYIRNQWATRRNTKPTGNKNTSILVGYPLYELEFIQKGIRDASLVFIHKWKSSGANDVTFNRNRSSELSLAFKLLTEALGENHQLQYIANDIMADFTRSYDEIVDTVFYIKSLHKEHEFSLAVWGLSPVRKRYAIIYSYLRSQGIPIVGTQHGACYGEQYAPKHFDTDFNHCDYFMSYGFTNADITNLYPDTKCNTAIIPVGKTVKFEAKRNREKVDLVYPISNSFSMTDVGLLRINPQELMDRQIALLKLLDSFEGKRIIIKPIVGSTYEECILYSLLPELKNLEIIEHLMFEQIWDKYSPNAILIDFPSTPLVQAISRDVEIFLMGDPIAPYSDHAKKLLQERVYYSESIEDLQPILSRFFNGNLEAKRNSEYMDHYVRRRNSHEAITNTLMSVVTG